MKTPAGHRDIGDIWYQSPNLTSCPARPALTHPAPCTISFSGGLSVPSSSGMIPRGRILSLAWARYGQPCASLLRTGRVPISTLMRRLLTGYAQQFNRRHRRHGCCFRPDTNPFCVRMSAFKEAGILSNPCSTRHGSNMRRRPCLG
jgi:hypothetical protein